MRDQAATWLPTCSRYRQGRHHLLAGYTAVRAAGGTAAGSADEILATAGRQCSSTDHRWIWPSEEWIAQWVADRGIQATRDNVLVLSGGQQGIDLSAKVFLNPGDNVLLRGRRILRPSPSSRMKSDSVPWLPMSRNNPESLEEAIPATNPRCDVVPTFQNPTGVTIPAERRKAIAEIAGRRCHRCGGRPIRVLA